MRPLQVGQQLLNYRRKATNIMSTLVTEKVITEKLQKTTNSTTLTQLFNYTTPPFDHLLLSVYPSVWRCFTKIRLF